MTNQAFTSFERAFDNLQGLGRVWASYGITMGKAALVTGAERLKATAGYLEGLSQRMDELKTQISHLPTGEEQPAEQQEQAPQA